MADEDIATKAPESDAMEASMAAAEQTMSSEEQSKPKMSVCSAIDQREHN
jgi:hypothetical protein